MHLHGLWGGDNRHCNLHVCGPGARVPPLPLVSFGLCVQRINGCVVRETRVGRKCHCLSLRAVPQGFLVRCFHHIANPSGI